MTAGTGVTDIHVHIQPQHAFHPAALELMHRGRTDPKGLAEITSCMQDPGRFLDFMDRQGMARAALINYVAPEVMGFTTEINDFVLRYAAHDRRRLLPFGSVNPFHSTSPGDDVERLAQSGIAGLKLHPPHMLFAANAYRGGLSGLAEIYERAQLHRLPVMIHTGTSIFPGARNAFADPMPIDDVAVDFPDLKIILAHGGRPLYMSTCFFLARRHKNVYLEISGIPPATLLDDYFPRLEALAAKTLWGTDWPGPGVPSPAENLKRFEALPLTESAKSAILRGNAELLFPDR